MKSSSIRHILIAVLLFVLPGCSLNLKAEPEIFIRFNQLGFLPNDIKTAVILSYNKLDGKPIYVYNSRSKEKVWNGSLDKNLGAYGNFPFSYSIDFSKVRNAGEYYIQYAQQKSYLFKINDNVYNGIADSLLKFFRVQRCGYTSPVLHKVCHIADATSLIEGGMNRLRPVDVTGGWHDAGDYVKFLNTTAFATYMLLFSYEFDPVKFGFDNNKNGVPDVLEEAKIGLDWLLRCYYNKNKLITQVQDLRDHDVGWRMPEDDKLGFDRPAFVGMGKNLIGIYSAAMALASRIWMLDRLKNTDFSNKCLKAAEELYSIRNQAADVDSSGSGMYLDKKYEGKLALGAAELYITSNKSSYLNDAVKYAEMAGSDFWWSWGDINALAHYRLAKFFPRFTDFLEKNLMDFNKRKDKSIFGKGTELSWGTNVTLIGISLQNILYKKLTGSSRYDSVSTFQRDFILGRNAWGVSFINGFGKNCTKNFHHQIAKIQGRLPGGFAAGPAIKSFVDKQKISFEQPDIYAKFQTENDYYRDDRMDFITNEPTITGNATAIFVFGNMSGKR